MKGIDQHPEKAQMVKAIEKNENPFKDHFKVCETCRHQFFLLEKLMNYKGDQVIKPNDAVIDRFKNIPILGKEQFGKKILYGSVINDSWKNNAELDIRDVTVGYVRRMNMKAGKISIELVAEKQENGWAFVARVYSNKKAFTSLVMKIGTKKILANASGYYQWKSKRAPKKIALQSIDKTIEFNELEWS